MGTGFAQTDPHYGPHTLGYGPALGTIHEYGCKLTTFADFCKWSGIVTDPVQLDVAFIAHGGIFQRDPTGTFDFMPDPALAMLWPDRFRWVGSWPGLRSDLIDKYLPTPDVFIALWIHANGVPTHYFPIVGGTGGKYVTDDSWDNVDKSIWAYAGLGVFSTIAIQSLHPAPPPKPVPVAPDSSPIVVAVPPPDIPPGEPHGLYDFVVVEGDNPDLHPMGGAWTKSQAITAAGEWVADKPAGYALEVVLERTGPDDRIVVFTAQSPAGLDRPGVV